MHDETAITIYADVTQAITSPSAADTRPVWSVDIAIKQWLDAKHKHTQSLRTYETYETHCKSSGSLYSHKDLIWIACKRRMISGLCKSCAIR